MNKERIMFLIELSQSVEEADEIIVAQGFTKIREKIAFLSGMFDIALIGRHDDAYMEEESALEMDYYAMLSAIINCKWEA